MSTILRVSNLPLCFDSSMLEDMFTVIGNVKKARVEMDTFSGLSRGFGFVEMSTNEEAQDCIHYFNGQITKGSTLSVREDVPHVPKRDVLKDAKRRTALRKTLLAVKRKS